MRSGGFEEGGGGRLNWDNRIRERRDGRKRGRRSIVFTVWYGVLGSCLEWFPGKMK
ncbi:hypothetical protein [Paenibacillus xylanexedens]|uniref:hypothetical protein n=1 Tax=Paenibacillus xylanexedens TaxID=528191 RepID=UPI001643147A|nr:hypothetical protein [Paenibacillus xylanexedens]